MKKLVQKFLENRCTPEEAEKVLQWLQTEEGETFVEEQMNKDQEFFFTSVKSDLYPELDSRELLYEIKKRKRKGKGRPEADNSKTNIHHKDYPNRLKHSIFVVAAAAVFLIVAVLVFNPLADQEITSESETTYQIVEAERGEQKEIQLRDGSIIVLNHESRIFIPEDFSESNRQVALEGEAWFEVVAMEPYPFEIEATNSYVRVLGTSFGVKSYPGEKSTRVVVTEGKVSLAAIETDGGKERVIEENQSGKLITGQEIELQDIPDTELYTGWKDGKLIFYNTPFDEVIKRVERWYDIECIITDPALKQEHFTSVFEGESLRQVLDVIALSMNVQYEIDNQTVTFKSNNL